MFILDPGAFGCALTSYEQCDDSDVLAIVANNLAEDLRVRFEVAAGDDQRPYTAECEIEVLQSFLGLRIKDLPRTTQVLSTLKQQLVDILNARVDAEYGPTLEKLRSLVGVTSKQKAAIVLNSMSPEFTAQFFTLLETSVVEDLIFELARLRDVCEEIRCSVLTEFFGEGYRAYLYDSVPCEGFVRRLLDWSVESPIGFEPERELLELPCVQSFSRVEKAAILFMTLPPEHSAGLFSELGPDLVQRITLEITQLPTVEPGERMAVVAEFLGFDVHLADYSERLECFVKGSPRRAAELLVRVWLG